MSHIIPIENEAHWHALRKTHIGGSEIQALLIEDKDLELSSDDSFTTANQLYFQKRGLINGVEVTPIMEWGLVMEPLIANMIAAEQGWTIEKCSVYHEHPKHTFLGCTLDYFALETPEGPVLLQIKNVVHTSHKWTQTKGTPYVEMQVLHELFVVNAARKDAGLEPFAAHCIGSMHRGNPEDIRLMFRVPDKQVEQAIVDAGARFMADLEAGREPDINNPKDYTHILELVKSAERYEASIDLTGRPDLNAAAERYLEVNAQRIALEKEEKALKAQLLRPTLEIKPEGVKGWAKGVLDDHTININTIDVNYKAKEAYTGSQTRITIK